VRTDVLEVNGITYPVEIHFEERPQATVSIGKRSINLRVPLSLGRDEQMRSILKMKQWAREHIQKKPPKKDLTKEYRDGDKLHVGDREYHLSISYASKQSSSARIQDKLIHLMISSELPTERQKAHISSLLSRLIARQRLPDLEKKLRQLNATHFQAGLQRIFFKNMRSRWGSCSEKGNINISTRLLFAPDEVLEYVCIHELAHLIEHNHSDRFWALVEKAMPYYPQQKQWLKEHGESIRF